MVSMAMDQVVLPGRKPWTHRYTAGTWQLAMVKIGPAVTTATTLGEDLVVERRTPPGSWHFLQRSMMSTRQRRLPTRAVLPLSLPRAPPARPRASASAPRLPVGPVPPAQRGASATPPPGAVHGPAVPPPSPAGRAGSLPPPGDQGGIQSSSLSRQRELGEEEGGCMTSKDLIWRRLVEAEPSAH